MSSNLQGGAIHNGFVEAALAVKQRPETGWSWLFLSGIASISFCVLIVIQQPLLGIRVIGIYIGIMMVIYGWVLMAFEKNGHI
jgi:uncharacterized membrane protein HdeD (DUF308 family)